MKTSLDKEIKKLAKQLGYPHQKLTYAEMFNVLKKAQQNVYGK